jgi:3-methyladenine DNA glycosylase/8-oxoguanine DNA glycosylase
MAVDGERPIETTLRLNFAVDARRTLASLWQSVGDQQLRFETRGFVRATRTAAGPASVRVIFGGGGEIAVQAWGTGAGEAIDGLANLLGGSDDPASLVPRHRIVGELIRRTSGLRLSKTGAIFESLLPAIVAQKVTGFESRNSYRGLLVRYGEPAPGPLRLTLPPMPETLARQPYWAFHELGVEQRRADVVRRAASAARALEASALSPSETRRRVMAIPGIGPWTAAETTRVALGDADAVSVGDYHLPNLVSWALAGEPRGTDERMLELLSPYDGQRARVVLLLEMSGLRPPRFGPRLAPRSIAAM